MNHGSYIFSQLLSYVPKDVFDRIVKNTKGISTSKSLPVGIGFALWYSHNWPRGKA